MLAMGTNGIMLLKYDTNLDKCPETYSYNNKSSGNKYKIVPLFKSIDCVDIVKQATPSADDKRFKSDYDAGFTCTESTGNYNAQAVVRRTAYVCSDGRIVLYDTNNSSVDFESTTDLSLCTYSSTIYGLSDGMEITIPESGYLAINPEKPFCGPANLIFSFVNVSNSASTTDMKYSEYNGNDQLLIAGPWVAIGKPGTYNIQYSSSQGIMRSRSSGMAWADEDSKSVSQTNRSYYKFQNTEGSVGFKRVAKGTNGYYNNATFSDGDRMYYLITDAIGDKIAEACGATSHTDLDLIPWHGKTPDDVTAVQGVSEQKAEAVKTVKVLTKKGIQIGNYNVAGQRIK